ncbi:MAG: hypothetical protein WA159_21080 [Variovorax sp.]
MTSVVIATTVAVIYQGVAREVSQRHAEESQELIERASEALSVFAAIHGRLPCVSLTADGTEDCAGSDEEGFLPHLSIGMPVRQAATLRYRVRGFLTRPPTATSPSPLLPLAEMLVLERDGEDLELRRRNLMDLNMRGEDSRLLDVCASLARPPRLNENLPRLPELAYSVWVTSTLAGAAMPIRSVNQADLGARLRCPAHSVATRAQFNAWLGAVTMSQAMRDYRAQFAAKHGTYGWDVSMAAWNVANIGYATIKAAVLRNQQMAQIALGHLTETVGMSFARNASVAVSVLNLGRASANVVRADKALKNAEAQQTRAETLQESTAKQAERSREVAGRSVTSTTLFVAERTREGGAP